MTLEHVVWIVLAVQVATLITLILVVSANANSGNYYHKKIFSRIIDIECDIKRISEMMHNQRMGRK